MYLLFRATDYALEAYRDRSVTFEGGGGVIPSRRPGTSTSGMHVVQGLSNDR
jgi:hypothetical protein